MIHFARVLRQMPQHFHHSVQLADEILGRFIGLAQIVAFQVRRDRLLEDVCRARDGRLAHELQGASCYVAS